MTVVPTGGMDWSLLLGNGPTDLCGLADAVDPALLVDAAVADDAGAVDGTAPDEPLLASGPLDAEPAAEFEPDEPPHAASSSTSDPIPVAAAHPLLRIISPIRKDDTERPGPSRRPARERWNLRRGRSAGATDDVALGHLDHVPHAADAVALGGQRLRALEGVQRAAVVGDLLGAVRGRDGAERAQPGVGRARQRLARHRLPDLRAGTGAGRRAALAVLVVRVDDLSVGQGEHPADGGLLNVQHGRARRYATQCCAARRAITRLSGRRRGRARGAR